MPARRNNQGSKPPGALVPFDDTETARTALKTILLARSITYAQLAELLAVQGVHETETSIAHKIRRGTFQLSFMYQCMRAIGVSQLVLDIPTQRSPDVARA